MLGLVIVGMLLIAAGIVIPIISMNIHNDLFRYLYAAGALLTLIGRLFSPYDGDNARLKRLYRIETWSSLFFCAAAFLLFYDKTNLRDPLAFTLAAGIIQIYTSIMIPRHIKKNN